MISLSLDSPIVGRLKTKAAMLASGDPAHQEIRPVLIVGGGGIRGAFSMGVLAGLEQTGLSSAFDTVISVSAGAPNCAYFLARQARLAVSVYTDDLTDNRFSNPWRLNKIVDIDYLVRVLRNVKPLDVGAVCASRSDFLTAVTSLAGEGSFQDVKTFPDIFDPIKASMALPLLYNRPVSLNGVPYLDGAVTLPLPIRMALYLASTDILVLVNYPIDQPLGKTPLLERLMSHFYFRHFPRAFAEAFLKRRKIYDQNMAILMASGGKLRGARGTVNVGIIAPPREAMIGRLTKSRTKVHSLALTGAQTALDIFAPGKQAEP
ncbi:MAG: patatin-like phospholipase family protein [Candidatus Liptonbacteria bacterium]|nr:patatin-like phospholipase family protein [Candidatus Liptonbacteria bacterium]